MHLPTVLNVLGRLLIVFAVLLMLPFGVALAYQDRAPAGANEALAFGISAAIGLVLGLLLQWRFKPDFERFGHREGFAIVGMGWITAASIGALPYCLVGADAMSYTDAFFESMSGLTTTGASVMGGAGPAIEEYGRGILFWRSFTHWLGGMGIVVLTVALLPSLGAGGYQMLKAEVPGPTAEKIAPRIAQTAKILWGVYVLLTVAEIFALWIPSWFVAVPTDTAIDPNTPYMDLFEASCHTFGTVATGGFSTRTGSMGAFTPYHQWVVIGFMVLAGTNFTIHTHLLVGRLRSLKNNELGFYLAVLLMATGALFVVLMIAPFPDLEENPRVYGHYVTGSEFEELDPGDVPSTQTQPAAADDNVAAEPRVEPDKDTPVEPVPPPEYATGSEHGHVEATARHAAFQAVSITTTTGYATADFNAWPTSLRLLLVMLMFFGGCAGSTGGGFKQFRMLTLIKFAWRELRQLASPRQIMHVKFDGAKVDDKVLRGILGVFVLYLALTTTGAFALSLMPGCDLETAVSAAIATIGNIGPGLSQVGATGGYGWMPDAGKWICSMLMLLGRLEIYSVLVLFLPVIYRR